MTLEELEVVVKGNTTDVIKKLENLKAQIQDSVQGSVQKAVEKAQPSFNALKQSFESVSATVNSSNSKTMKSFEILGREIELQKKKVMELRKQYEAFNTYKSLGTKLENHEISLKEYMNARSALPHNIKDVSVQLEQAEIQLAKMTLRAENMRSKMEQAGNEAKKTGKKVSQSMNKASTDVQKATKHTSKFLQTFSRILRVMVVKGIINQAIQGFNDLTKASSEYNAVMSNIQASMLQARNAITTAFAPALQMLEPYIVKFAEIVSDLFTKIAMYASAFAGNNFYYRATKVTTNYAQSLETASKAQQKLLAGFDELNVLQEKQNGSGSTGLPDATDMFEKVAIPEDVLEKVANFKQKFEELLPILEAIGVIIAGYKLGELFGLWGKGTSLVDKLTGAFRNKNDALGQQQEDYAKEFSALKNLVPAFATAGASAWAFGQVLKGIELKMPDTQPIIDFSEAFETARSFIQERLTGIQTALDGAKNFVLEKLNEIQTGWETMKQTVSQKALDLKVNVETAWNTMTTNVVTWSTNMWTSVSTSVVNFTQPILTKVSKWIEDMKSLFSNGFFDMSQDGETLSSNIQKSVKTFVENTAKNIKSWIERVIEPAIELMQEMNEASGENMFSLSGAKKALKNAGQNIANFASSIIEPFKNTITSTAKSIGEGVNNYVVKPLSEAGQAVYEWASTRGEVYERLKRDMPEIFPEWDKVGMTIGGGILVGTGLGAGYTATTGDTTWLEQLGEMFSQLVPAMAGGGVLTKPTLAVVGEYAGAGSNPEIVAPQSLMLETNLKANVPVMNAIEEMGDKLVGAINNIGVYAEFDYSKLKVGLDNENAKVGGKLYGV